LDNEVRQSLCRHCRQLKLLIAAEGNKLTFKPGPSQFTPADHKQAAKANARASD
jgi:hypothetical protein